MGSEEEELLPNTQTEKVRVSTTERRLPDDSFITKMKKYTKLILSVVAVISFFSFIFYKFRYDRLYNVMQVLEVFGTPDDPSVQPCTSEDAWLPPTWQSHGPSLHLYSAHCSSTADSESKCSRVSILAVSTSSPSLQCRLWIEGATKAMEGIFAVADLESGDDFSAFILSCESKFPDKAPYAVTLYTPGGEKTHIPVASPYQGTAKQFLQLCILAPPSPVDNSVGLKESLLLHTFLRVRSIQVYSPSLPPSVVATMASLRPRAKLVAAPWHPPPLSHHLISTLAAWHCHQTSRLSHESWLLLSPDQVLLPTSAASLSEASKQLLQGHLAQGPQSLPVRRFCSEYPTEKQASLLNPSIRVFQSTFYNKQLSKETFAELNWLESSSGIPSVKAEDVLMVNEYGECQRHDFSATDKDAQYEAGAMRFAKEFILYCNKYNRQ